MLHLRLKGSSAHDLVRSDLLLHELLLLLLESFDLGLNIDL
jgi:hypothetical protein